MYRLRWPLALASLLICFGLFGAGVSGIITFSKQVYSLREEPPKKFEPKVFDSRLEIWFDQEDPALQAFFEIEKEFIPEDIVLIAFQDNEDPWGVFGDRSLETIARLTERIDKVPYVRNVRSLTSAPWVRWGEVAPGEQGLLVTDLFENKPESYSRDERLLRMIAVLGAERASKLAGEDEVRRVLGPDASFDDHMGEPRFINGIISEDGRTTALAVKILREKLPPEVIDETFGDNPTSRAVGPAMHANEMQWEALDGIQEALNQESYDFHVVGLPAWQRNFMVTGMSDMKYVGLLFVVLSLLLFFLYRRKSAVLIPILVVNAAVMGMVGWMFLIGDLINNITSLTPHIVTAVGIADAVHMVSAYFLLRPGFSDKRPLIITMMRRNALPVFLTSITTAVGFFALTTSSIYPLTQFGYTGGVGVLFAYAVSMTVVPALLSLIPVKKNTKIQTIASDDYATPYWTDNIVQFTIRRRKAIIIGSLVVLAGATYSASRVQLNNDYREWFSEGNRTIADVLWLEDRLGGVGDLEIVFSAPDPAEEEREVRARQSRIEELEIRRLLHPETASDASGSPDRPLPSSLSAEERAELLKLRETVRSVQRRIDQLETGWARKGQKQDPKPDGAGDPPDPAADAPPPDDGAQAPDDDVVDDSAQAPDDGAAQAPDDTQAAAGDAQPGEGEDGAAQPVADIPDLDDAPVADDLADDADIGAVSWEGVELPPPLTEGELAELKKLKEEEARYQRQRIAVSNEFLTLVDRFERRLLEEMANPKSPVSKLRKINSGLDVLRKINQVQNQNRSEFYRVPTDADVPALARTAQVRYDDVAEEFYLVPAQDASSLAAQFYIQYENGAKPAENLSSLISPDRRTFRMAVRADQAGSKEHVAAFDRIREILRTEFPELIGTPEQVRSGEALASMVMTGKLYLFSTSIDEFALNMIKSLTISLIVITLLIVLIYRSIRLGLVAIIPNVLPLAIPLGFFGLLGIYIDSAVVVIASICLGVAVDDTVHLLTKFKQARDEGLNAEDALRVAMRKTGTALTFTTIILVAGFSVMSFSDFHPNVMIGKLASVVIALAWVADMLVTPALLSYFRGGVPLQTTMAPVPAATLVGEQKRPDALPTRAMLSTSTRTDFHTLVIGAGQFGLATGFYLSRAGVDYTILEGGTRVGDRWRNRWDSLRLFTPTRYNSLPGLPFQTSNTEDWYRPTKDETADYLESYANHFSLPIRYGVRVKKVDWEGGRYVVITDNDQRFRADNVIVTTGFFNKPKVPGFARDLDPSIVQLHSSQYVNPGQLNDGDVLVVGAGTSGCEIAIELVQSRRAYLAGDDHGRVPARVLGIHVFWLFPFISGRPNTSFIGRKFHKSVSEKGWPLVRFTYGDVTATGVERVPRVSGVIDGRPVLENGQIPNVSNVIWGTGFLPDFSWINLPIFGKDGNPLHNRGIVEGARGIYFVGLPFQYAENSTLLYGAARDAKHVVEHLLNDDEDK